MRRLVAVTVAVISAVSALAMFGLAAPAGADAGAEAEFVDRINGARASSGKGSLATHAELTSVARRWSKRMADEQRLAHNPNLANEVQADWEKLAENVGFGQDVGQIHEAFMNSTAHRNNILDGGMTHVGVGVVVDGSGQIWVTEIFMRLRGGGDSSPPPTTSPPPRAPAPTAAPAPAPTSPPTTRAPRVTTATTARPAPAPTAAPTTVAPDADAEAAAAAAKTAEAAAARTPTPRLVLVLDGLRALDQGR